MRTVWIRVSLLLPLCLTGCVWQMFGRQPQSQQGISVASAQPSAQELVAALNANAQRVQALECRDLDLDCTQGVQPIGLRANLICQKPRNFRMNAKWMGNTAVDVGSNSQEFWFWLSKGDPYLFHCSYNDFAAGRAQMPFPFQPEWIMEALGMAEFDPAKQYEVIPLRNGEVDLVAQGLSPQGRPVRKVTRLKRMQNNQWQVTAHLLQDPQGKEICSAFVAQVWQDPNTGVLVPRQVKLVWPAERLTMKMTFLKMAVNPPALTPDRVSALFTRPVLQDVASYDLAHGPDAAAGALQRTGGYVR